MSPSTLARTASGTLFASALLLAAAIPAQAATPSGYGPPTSGSHCRIGCGILFDDFDYGSDTDPKLAANGWTVRTAEGGPGVEGAAWLSSNVSFPVVDGHRSLQLRSATDGTAAGTSEAEFSRSAEESLAGTYVARVKFADTPASGTDGDALVQSFFAISTNPDCDPTYSETDFSEYLPNGGYGDPRTLNSETTWALTGADCSDSVEDIQARSFAGWHTIVSTVAAGHVKYYIDGILVADHSGHYYPRHDMAIDFNQWFVDTSQHVGSGTSVWTESVDYVLYAKDRVLTPRQATLAVDLLRLTHTSYVNRLG